MPILGLGAVLLVEGESGSYGLAGAVAGTLALVGSLASPQWARAVDRRGQSVVLPIVFTGYLVFGVAFVAAVVLHAPTWSWFVLAGLCGLCGPNIGAIVRARWAHALDSDRRQTAFAFESVVDEVVFVVGPPLVTFLATLINPPVGFLTGVVIGFCGAMWLSRLRTTEPPVHVDRGAAPRRASALRSSTVLLVGLAYLAVGAVFGAMDVVVVAYAEEEGCTRVRRNRTGRLRLREHDRGARLRRRPPARLAGRAVPRLRRVLRRRHPGVVRRRLAGEPRRGRLPGGAGHRAGARLGHVPGGVAGVRARR